MNFLVPTRFVWRYGGGQVSLCGSFTRWVETVPMVPVEGQPNIFTVVVHLPPGYHQYKFIVDGEWRHDETQPFMPDPLGNVNNWLFVRRVDVEHGHGQQQQQVQHGAQMQDQAQLHSQLQAHHQLVHQQQIQQLQQQMLAQAQVQVAQGGSGEGLSQQLEQQLKLQQGAVGAVATARQGDVNMEGTSPGEGAEGAYIPAKPENEPEFTQRKILEFLQSHTVYELIPESGKVVLLDTMLPVRQAFHALSEQGIASAPLWDSEEGTIVGLISATDFIRLLQELITGSQGGSNPLTEAQMDQVTIRDFRRRLRDAGMGPPDLVFVTPEGSLLQAVRTLVRSNCSTAPILTCDPESEGLPELLCTATVPLDELPIGTWVRAAVEDEPVAEGKRVLDHLVCVTTSTLVTTALQQLLEQGTSCLPVVDDRGALLDIFAKADITLLARGNSYSQLQHQHDVTVGQVLALSQLPGYHGSSGQLRNMGSVPGGLSQAMHAAGQQAQPASGEPSHVHPMPGAQPKQRVWTVNRKAPLKDVLDKLCIPGVRRVMVVDGDTRQLQALISSSDVAKFLLYDDSMHVRPLQFSTGHLQRAA